MKLRSLKLSCLALFSTAVLTGCGGGSGGGVALDNQFFPNGTVQATNSASSNAIGGNNSPNTNAGNSSPGTIADNPSSPATPVAGSPGASPQPVSSGSPAPATFRIGNAVAAINYYMTAWTVNDLMKTAGFETSEPATTRQSEMWVPIVGGEWRTFFDRSSPEAFIAEAITYVEGTGAYTEDAPEPGLRFAIRSDRALAAEFNLPLVAYEGGQHFMGSTFTRDMVNTHQDMYDLYRAYFDVWQQEGGDLFVHLNGLIPRGQNEPGTEPNYFQSENFGIKETQTQSEAEAPKWRAVLDEMREIGQIL